MKKLGDTVFCFQNQSFYRKGRSKSVKRQIYVQQNKTNSNNCNPVPKI